MRPRSSLPYAFFFVCSFPFSTPFFNSNLRENNRTELFPCCSSYNTIPKSVCLSRKSAVILGSCDIAQRHPLRPAGKVDLIRGEEGSPLVTTIETARSGKRRPFRFRNHQLHPLFSRCFFSFRSWRLGRDPLTVMLVPEPRVVVANVLKLEIFMYHTVAPIRSCVYLLSIHTSVVMQTQARACSAAPTYVILF